MQRYVTYQIYYTIKMLVIENHNVKQHCIHPLHSPNSFAYHSSTLVHTCIPLEGTFCGLELHYEACPSCAEEFKIYIVILDVIAWSPCGTCHCYATWWRHQMETFSALLAICGGNSPVIGEFPAQRPVTRSFDAFFDLPLNKRLSKQWWGWWFETLLRPLWRHCKDV